MVRAWEYLKGKTLAVDRAELPGNYFAGQVQDRIMPAQSTKKEWWESSRARAR